MAYDHNASSAPDWEGTNRAGKANELANKDGDFRGESKRSADTIAIICTLGFIALYVSGIALNGLVYSRVAVYFGAAREIATICGGLTYLCALFIARFRPEWLFMRRISIVMAVLGIVMIPALAFALSTQEPVITTVTLCIRAVVRAWAMTLMVASLLRVRSPKFVTIVVAAGLLLANVARPLMPFVDSPLGASTVVGLATLMPILLLTGIAHPVLDRVRTGAPADVVELLHPGAFLKPSHALFMCVLLFSTASGYAMTLGEVENAPVDTNVLAFALLLVIVYVVVVKGDHQEDSLFSFSVVLVMAGFLMVPLTFDTESIAANGLMDIGENCFDILLWLTFVSVGRRNLFAMLPTFGLAEFCSTAGTDIGAVLGHTSNMLVHGDERMVISFALILAFVFFAFLWVGFRRFSFTEVIAGMESLHAVEGDKEPMGRASEDAAVRRVGERDGAGRAHEVLEGEGSVSDAGAHPDGQADVQQAEPTTESPAGAIARRCDELAEDFGLTEREREIFAMLARGRNARFIMEEFVLSRNTVKSHIKHIYAKLGVHSQQELIDLVEGE